MAIQLGNLPSTAAALVDPQGRATVPLQQFFAAIKRGFAAVPAASPSGDTYRNKHVMWWLPQPGSATPQAVGFKTTAFAAIAAAPAATSYLTQFYRYAISTTAVAGTQGSHDTATPAFWRGNAAGLGGFYFEQMMGIAATQTTMRTVCGLSASAVNILATDPSALTDCVFLGCDSADTNMQIMVNDSAGTCTKTDLGSSFPKTNNAVYTLALDCAQNGSAITYTVTRRDVAAIATGTLSADLPTSTAFMDAGWWVGNGATAAVATINAYKITAAIPE